METNLSKIYKLSYREKNNYAREVVSNIITKLLEIYNFEEASTHGNEEIAWTLRYSDSDLRMSSFSTFVTINMAIGKVMHFPYENRLPVGEKGIISASSSLSIWEGGDPRYNHDGKLRWRIDSLYPKSRTLYRDCEKEPKGIMGLGLEIETKRLFNHMYSMKPPTDKDFEQSPFLVNDLNNLVDGW